ncbi:MAG: hypothetical protein EAX87_06765 [Candidatus Thorarchaeota archaeon]|nr:hypothetical protein [Candidatus Thorarchaeota archaeon]
MHLRLRQNWRLGSHQVITVKTKSQSWLILFSYPDKYSCVNQIVNRRPESESLTPRVLNQWQLLMHQRPREEHLEIGA